MQESAGRNQQARISRQESSGKNQQEGISRQESAAGFSR
jgi:hypothetical protein